MAEKYKPYAEDALTALLWSSTVYKDTEDDNAEGIAADKFEPTTELVKFVDCQFQKFEEMVQEAMPYFDPDNDYRKFGNAWKQMEHDFILTINETGAGFWDGDWTHGEQLTAICKQFKPVEVYLFEEQIHRYGAE